MAAARTDEPVTRPDDSAPRPPGGCPPGPALSCWSCWPSSRSPPWRWPPPRLPGCPTRLGPGRSAGPPCWAPPASRPSTSPPWTTSTSTATCGGCCAASTGDFRSQFRAGTKDLTALVTENKATSQGEVLDAGIVSDDADSARVLVVADSTVTNSADPKPQKRHYRMQLDLVREGSRWLVSDLQFVG